jgi:hypothetical protein
LGLRRESHKQTAQEYDQNLLGQLHYQFSCRRGLGVAGFLGNADFVSTFIEDMHRDCPFASSFVGRFRLYLTPLSA